MEMFTLQIRYIFGVRFQALLLQKKSYTRCIQAILKIGNKILRHVTVAYHHLGLCVEPSVVLNATLVVSVSVEVYKYCDSWHICI